ncbi:coiled-coil domain-containing protein 81-like isoform X2 [Liolophura sinensis]|uniref:coiled-coil domain-containing protein 81-like isoform X2 n=1 Tax=Liolophura sinensis TaxID=3198878 RepID=UPI0031591CDF
MTEAIQGILAEARKNRFCTINPALSDEDVASVWDNVSGFIEKQMSNQKGVTITGLGTFTFMQKKLDIGNNKFILIQRPVFQISEKLAYSQGLQSSKYHVPGQIPVVPLNFAALAFESPFDRDTVESCVKEVLGAVSRAVGNKRNVELTFAGVGKLSIRESKVKMRFYKEFITQMDGSGKLISSMQNRPGTMDSVMSDRPSSRPHSTNTLLLPRLNPSHPPSAVGQSLAPLPEMSEDPLPMEREPTPPTDPTRVLTGGMGEGTATLDTCVVPQELQFDNKSDFVTEEPVAADIYKQIQEDHAVPDTDDPATAAAIDNILREPVLVQKYEVYKPTDDGDLEGRLQLPRSDHELYEDTRAMEDVRHSQLPSRSGSRTAIPLAQATGVSLTEDLFQHHVPKPSSRSAHLSRSSPNPLQSPINGHGSRLPKPITPPKLEPLSRSRTEPLLDAGEKTVQFKAPSSACGHSNAGQELCYLCHQRARRNIPVSFKEEIKAREEEDDRLLLQYQSMKDAEEFLKEQDKVLVRRHDLQKMSAFNLGVADAIKQKKNERDTEFHKSYVFQKRPLTPPRFFKQEEYCRDLAKQVESKEQTKKKCRSDEEFLERLEQVQLAEDLAAQREQYLVEKYEHQDMYRKALDAQVCHKPLPIPAKEADKEIFGKNDMNNEKMAERRQLAHSLFREQQDLVAQRKREAILKRLAEQREEEAVLQRTKREILEDRADRFKRRFDTRKKLESDWCQAAECKRARDLEEKLRGLNPGLLLHDTVDQHKRCKQCLRKLINCGESNIWRESRYIPGSRLMV